MAGTEIRVPRRFKLSRFVGAQMPDGFDPTVWGLGSMMESVDRLAVWNLVSTVDAFLSSGFKPAELLRWVHPAVGQHPGHRHRRDAVHPQDVRRRAAGREAAERLLQEALPNVIAAHTVQSYLGGYGAMVHPVAACATTAVCVEEGVDKIRLDKASVVVAGGFDDLSIEGILGFGDMSATADTAAMRAKGIEERHVCRANDRRRGGFVEAQGGGTSYWLVVTSLLEMGLPVLGVVAYAGSFADGIHTSIPAPGLGALGAGVGGTRLAAGQGPRVGRPRRRRPRRGVEARHLDRGQRPQRVVLHERLAAAIGRTTGNPLFVVSQKSLTGHAKGGAAAFQMIGLCQVLATGSVPPNRGLDCVDEALSENEHLVWLRQPLRPGRSRPVC